MTETELNGLALLGFVKSWDLTHGMNDQGHFIHSTVLEVTLAATSGTHKIPSLWFSVSTMQIVSCGVNDFAMSHLAYRGLADM